MITKTKRTKRRRNPVLESEVNTVLDKLDPKYISYLAEGDYSEVYKFEITENKEIDDVILKKGTYVIKFFKQDEDNYLNFKDILYLKKLSNLKIIPKIYVITENYIIMDFINGKTLEYVLTNTEHPGKKSNLLLKLERLISKLHDKKIAHGDLHLRNVLIDLDENLYLIDPVTNSKTFENDNRRLMRARSEFIGE